MLHDKKSVRVEIFYFSKRASKNEIDDTITNSTSKYLKKGDINPFQLFLYFNEIYS